MGTQQISLGLQTHERFWPIPPNFRGNPQFPLTSLSREGPWVHVTFPCCPASVLWEETLSFLAVGTHSRQTSPHAETCSIQGHPREFCGSSWFFSSAHDLVSASPPSPGHFTVPAAGLCQTPSPWTPLSPLQTAFYMESGFPTQCSQSCCSFFSLPGCLHPVSQTGPNPLRFVCTWTVNSSYTMLLLSRICSGL